MSIIPETGFLRLSQIIGDRKRGITPIIPISKSAWWAGVAAGRLPPSIKLSSRTTVWRAEDIRALVEQLANDAEPRKYSEPKTKLVRLRALRAKAIPGIANADSTGQRRGR